MTAEFDLSLKQMLITECNVRNCEPSDIQDDEPLIGGPGKLKLDSLDAVEIVSTLERKFAIRLENPGDARKVLTSFTVLREYVLKNADHQLLQRFNSPQIKVSNDVSNSLPS